MNLIKEYTPSGRIKEITDYAFKMGMAQVREEYEAFLSWADEKNIINFLEIGSKLGGSFFALSRVTKGRQISIDLKGGDFGGWITNYHPYLENVYDKRNKYLAKIIPGCELIDDFMRMNLNYDLKGDKLGLAFLDGDHTYEGVKQDYELVKDYVNGWIVFHDINDTPHHRSIGVGVAKLWNELEGEKVEFNSNSHWAGIGAIRHG
jgi:hypothetical protein